MVRNADKEKFGVDGDYVVVAVWLLGVWNEDLRYWGQLPARQTVCLDSALGRTCAMHVSLH